MFNKYAESTPLKNSTRKLRETSARAVIYIIHKDILLFKIFLGLLTGFFCHYNYFAVPFLRCALSFLNFRELVSDSEQLAYPPIRASIFTRDEKIIFLAARACGSLPSLARARASFCARDRELIFGLLNSKQRGQTTTRVARFAVMRKKKERDTTCFHYAL